MQYTPQHIEDAYDYFMVAGMIDNHNSDDKYYIASLCLTSQYGGNQKMNGFNIKTIKEAVDYFMNHDMIGNHSGDARFYIGALLSEHCDMTNFDTQA